jgi:ATP-dependent helicase Lhr and Lhr-like helicase
MPLEHFYPTIRRWFAARFGEPTEPQREGWERIRSGRHTLISAPTGTGKTIAGYLWAIDGLARQGAALANETEVLYISPLRALSNDVQKNLQGPLAELAEMDPEFPEIRVLVRTGDTPQRDRAKMLRKPPHILVTTPESLYILLTAKRGREMLSTVKTVIVDEIHALARDKRGSHLALSLERLEALVGGRRSEVGDRKSEVGDHGAGAMPTAMGGHGAREGMATQGSGHGTHEPSLLVAAHSSSAFQRIGLSATQKPLSEVGRFLVGAGRECELVDVGHRRAMDIAIEVPPSPLSTVCSHEQWDEIYREIAALIEAHRTTLVFVNTRKLAERITARLTEVLGEEQVTCHHSSLSKERRLDAEHRLKSGSLRALVATASLELGIDIGDVDLVVQVGATRSIATLLQRVGRSGHAVRKMPKGRLFPLTIDELIEAAALLRAIKRGDLDRTPQPAAPLDILAQQIVAACVAASEPVREPPAEKGTVLNSEDSIKGDSPRRSSDRREEGWPEDALYETFRRAWPYRDLKREDFDSVIELHLNGRRGLLHRDGVGGRIMARKRARIPAITGGGAIPDVADYQVRQQPDDTFVGTLNEDFAIEANVGDIFQLGNTSWRILKVERGVVRVADAQGQPPSIPFWLGEGASRTAELSAEIADVREQCGDVATLENDLGLVPEAALQIAEYLADGRRVLGTVPTQKRVVLERFFDESGGMQLVLHAPFGGRINRAWGLALRKRFCRGFGFELQAAANEEAIVISLGLKHSFPLEEVFDYLHPNSVRKVLTQAVLDQPMFESRWRWNATRSLMLERFQNGKPLPPQIIRMRAGDLLAASFPAAVACPENLPPGDLEIPMDHPLVRQTIDDCLSEATDIEGLISVLAGLRDGSIERVAVDTTEPSAFARGILNSERYTFLDDAPLEERRTQAVLSRRTIDPKMLDNLGALDPAAVERVREEAWPQPESSEDVHDALTWLGFVTDEEAASWLPWLVDLAGQNRVVHADGRWRAIDGPTDLKTILLGRLEGLGPVFEGDPRISLVELEGRVNASGNESGAMPAALGGHDAGTDMATQGSGHGTLMLLLELEKDGAILRTRLDGKTAWCERRLLARIHRSTVEKLRREIEPVSAGEFLQFLACWQHVDEEFLLEGPRGVAEVLAQLAGFEARPRTWEAHILPRRVRDYRREWLDEVTMSGEFAWGRLWGSAASAIRVTPIAIIPREQLDDWLALSEEPKTERMSGPAADLLQAMQAGGPMFPQSLPKAANLVPAHVEMGLADLLARGLVTCDSFAAVRQMITPPSRRRHALPPVGRWCCFRVVGVQALACRDSLKAELQQHATGASLRSSPGHPAATNGHPSRALSDDQTEMIARQLLRRTGVVFRRMLEREKIPVTWSALRRVYRRLELRGEIRGGRFVAGFSGEQFALPEAIALLRRLRRQGPRPPISVFPADPLNFEGIVTPAETAASIALSPANGSVAANGAEAHSLELRRQRIVG